MKVFKLRKRLHKHTMLLLEHGTGWLVTSGGTVKTLVEKTFDTLEQVEQWVDDLPNRLMEHEADEWDEEYKVFVEKEHDRGRCDSGVPCDPGDTVDKSIET